MVKRILLTVTLVASLFVLSASVSQASLPLVGTDDSCAAVFTEDANACGGDGYPIGACEHINYWGWFQLWYNGYVVTYKPCLPGNMG